MSTCDAMPAAQLGNEVGSQDNGIAASDRASLGSCNSWSLERGQGTLPTVW